MTILRLQRKYGCLLANNNRLAKEIYNSLAIICHTGTLTGLRDKSVLPIGLPPASRPSIGKVVRMLALNQHKKNNLRATREAAQVTEEKPKPDILVGYSWPPFQPLPNVRSMTVSFHGMNKIFEHFKIDRRNRELKMNPHTNKPKMRYAAMVINRLRTYEDHRYWTLAHFIMGNSVVFNLMAINKTFPRWHREMPLNLVLTWLYNVQKIVKGMYTRLQFKRIYIPKPNGKLRPLGVPSPIWRIIMCQLNWILITRIARYIPNWQHAYLPGRGTKSAWETILHTVVKKPYIYEFDLSNFFGSVHPPRVLKWFQNKGAFPSDAERRTLWHKGSSYKMNVTDWITSLSYCVPNFPQGIEQADKDLYMGTANIWENPIWATETKGNYWFEQIAKHGAVPISSEWGNYGKTYGWPQGANISPLMSIALLGQASTPPPYDIIMYADDGVFSSEQPIEVNKIREWFKDLGLNLNEEKSGFVCWEKQWFKPLKFLGLKYRDDLLMSETRSGTEMKFDKEDLAQALLEAETPTKNSSIPFSGYITIHKKYGRITPKVLTQRRITYVDNIAEYQDIQVYELPVESWATAEFREYVVWCESSEITYGHHGKQGALRQAQALNNATDAYWKVARFTLDGTMLVPNISKTNSWEAISSSLFFGWIQSKLYAGNWNSEEFQNFNLKGVPKSWLYRSTNQSRKLNFANSTSYAVSDVATIYRNSKRKELWKKEYVAGTISFQELNRRRREIGYAALKFIQKIPVPTKEPEQKEKIELGPIQMSAYGKDRAESLDWMISFTNKLLKTGIKSVQVLYPESWTKDKG